ncbi:MAG TPA: CaiB/BaiF CoA-transferase family protein [Ramlibacter sp.]|uniref:CaiB/BaiF CoA transferase family protein n=1 Tax=Ramlibacter sp. TaxID=1917967 RepID=UPI002C02F0DF|nr:CaiB/BaiF CoA-transferase family protein [Ramlibacter sp.]HVZ45773.1 CaiB/BaiF CoA-transferase family protein [Ramlibacter sp.]
MAAGPLDGLKVVEFAGLGPAPMCAMLMADLGATVIRLDRARKPSLGVEKPLQFDLTLRNRPAISIDLKSAAGVAAALELLATADVCLEGFRPGVMERLGLGPDQCLSVNRKLVYGRMTGWGQDGPLARNAGHDVNYIALTGALHAIGRAGQPPTPPLNLVGDYGGGALYLAFGCLAGVLCARVTGQGQVVDAAMVDGAASLMMNFFGNHAAGLNNPERGTNIVDSGAPYYDAYECSDGKFVAVGAIESRFRQELFAKLGLAHCGITGDDRSEWPKLREAIAAAIRTRTRDEWAAAFAQSDACFSPVLSMAEAPDHPHNRARGTFFKDAAGIVQPGPAPRFSATPAALPGPPRPVDANVEQALLGWGVGIERIRSWRRDRVVGLTAGAAA